MNEKERDKVEVELGNAFKNGQIFNASDEDLDRYLLYLTTGYVANENVRHREINRCQLITTVKLFRFISKIDTTNKLFTWIIIFLSVLAIVISVYTTRFNLNQANIAANQMERLVGQIEHLVQNQDEVGKKITQEIEMLQKVQTKKR